MQLPVCLQLLDEGGPLREAALHHVPAAGEVREVHQALQLPQRQVQLPRPQLAHQVHQLQLQLRQLGPAHRPPAPVTLGHHGRLHLLYLEPINVTTALCPPLVLTADLRSEDVLLLHGLVLHLLLVAAGAVAGDPPLLLEPRPPGPRVVVAPQPRAPGHQVVVAQPRPRLDPPQRPHLQQLPARAARQHEAVGVAAVWELQRAQVEAAGVGAARVGGEAVPPEDGDLAVRGVGGGEGVELGHLLLGTLLQLGPDTGTPLTTQGI